LHIEIFLAVFDAVGWAAGRASGHSLSLASINPEWFYLSGTSSPW